jgi:hypothetical protein
MEDENDSGLGLIGVGAAFFLGGILCAFGILALQIYWYLQGGIWIAFSFIDGVTWLALKFDPTFADNDSWLVEPTSWIGVHKLLAGTPLAVSLLLIGVAIGWICMNVVERK